MITLAPLPEFDNPPVSEVALAVAFSPLPNWSGPHSGLFWGGIREDYPLNEVHPPIAASIENVEDSLWPNPPEINIQLGHSEAQRTWFLNKDKSRLIQVQRDRFVINWRKVTGTEVYPRYVDDLRPRFLKEWQRFQIFARGAAIGDITVTQCEVTYVNDIPQGQGWDDFSQALALFSPWWGRGSDGFLGKPEMLTVNGAFLLPGKLGRLHFVARPARRLLDQKKVVQLRLTVRGKPASGADADVLTWMDMARDWIVRSFADLTSPTAHKLWERKQ